MYSLRLCLRYTKKSVISVGARQCVRDRSHQSLGSLASVIKYRLNFYRKMSNNSDFRINISDGLILYHHRYSFYSQKVLLALYEKKLPFESHVVEITKGQQYEPWFLSLNPRGEVPVLQDGSKIIPDSTKIIDYLEDKYSKDTKIPELIPMRSDPAIRQCVNHFRRIVDQLPMGAITMGSFMHPELVNKPKAPFYAPVRKTLLNAENKSAETLRKHAELNPKSREILLRKAEAQEKKHAVISNKDEYLELLLQTEKTLDLVEKQLSINQTKWLSCNNFTAADISLSILLYRLEGLGLSHTFWSKQLKPNLFNYYTRVQQRESFKQAVPDLKFHFKTILCNTPKPILVGVGVTIALVIVLAGAAIFKVF